GPCDVTFTSRATRHSKTAPLTEASRLRQVLFRIIGKVAGHVETPDSDFLRAEKAPEGLDSRAEQERFIGLGIDARKIHAGRAGRHSGNGQPRRVRPLAQK